MFPWSTATRMPMPAVVSAWRRIRNVPQTPVPRTMADTPAPEKPVTETRWNPAKLVREQGDISTPNAGPDGGDGGAHPAVQRQRHDEPIERAREIHAPGEQAESEAAADGLRPVRQRDQERRKGDPPERGMPELWKAQREEDAGEEREGEIQRAIGSGRTS